MASVEENAVAIVTVPAKEKALKKKSLAGKNKPKVAPTHPPYVEMIKDAIVALKERTGSSQIAIAKFIEEKQKSHLPSNFKKLLLVQLKKLVAAGKLVKVKNSFKISAVSKPANPTAKKAIAAKAPAKKKVAAKPKTVVKKPKSAAAGKVKVAPAKSKVVAKAKAVAKSKPKTKSVKAAKTSKVTSPGKKLMAKVKKVPAKAVKKVKSIKSPVKKAPTKKN